MVISTEKREESPDPTAAPTPARSLHNFTSFPILKTWGHRKLLRCVKRHGHRFDSPILSSANDDEGFDFERDPSLTPWNLRARTVRLRSKAEEMRKKKESPRFSISLSMREIDEDIYSLTGSRARRRPRKRPRPLQKLLDGLFPGSWLTEITADTYRVPE